MHHKITISLFIKIFLYNTVVSGTICLCLFINKAIGFTIFTVISFVVINVVAACFAIAFIAKPFTMLLRSIQSLVNDRYTSADPCSKEHLIMLTQELEQFKARSDSLLREKDAIVNELIESKKLLEKYSNNLEEMVEQRTEILKWLSITDPLTGLYNRRYFIEQIELEFKRSKRYNRDLSLLMLDIDHFKSVNDNYGHQVGDIVLRKISSIIISQLRDSDLAFRYGGEEFMVILPETRAEDAINVAKRMKQEIMETEHIYRNLNFKVTASIGIVSIKDMLGKFETVDDIIKKVDDNLYKAKNSGRNTIIYE
ncbi:MAG: GGDEF domain-containing protein [Spirochaetota bacterium]|nr:GGDEF domain-containing protein [Spirochaetota bacterium]